MAGFPDLIPTAQEAARREAVMDTVLTYIREGRTIKLPDFDAAHSQTDPDFALLRIGAEPNAFSGLIGPYRYQFEGEEDLLHLMVVREDGQPLTAEEGQSVCSYLLPQVPTALLWFRPGDRSQHFYFGHELLL